MKYPSVEQVKNLHQETLKSHGGLSGIRDEQLLEYLVFRPQLSLSGIEIYKGIFRKAAALLEGITGRHPFVDGNKRTGWLAMRVFLAANGYELQYSQDEAYAFVLDVAKGEKSLAQIAQWIRIRAQRAPKHWSEMTPYELGESKSKEAIPYLIAFTESPHPNERRLSASALGKLAHFKPEIYQAQDPLIHLLKDPYPQVRQYSAKALGRIGNGKVLKALKELLHDEKGYVRQAAQEAIWKLRKRAT